MSHITMISRITGTDLYIPGPLEDSFKQLVQRGANLWPDAPPEIKEFSDLITTGKVNQNYFAQAGKSRPQCPTCLGLQTIMVRDPEGGLTRESCPSLTYHTQKA